ncbi:MAG TPA: hypothetical protein DCY13_02520 [Verrucomicrobiales bacterium]|nr:hypothetical protein [Verrucomicrobiales bacterium]
MTNRSQVAITYYGYARELPLYQTLKPGLLGWERKAGGWWCGTGVHEHTLAPGEGIDFGATVPTGERCKIRFSYSDGQTRTRIWEKLPNWIADRLPRVTEGPNATTPVIDLRPGSTLLAKSRTDR